MPSVCKHLAPPIAVVCANDGPGLEWGEAVKLIPGAGRASYAKEGVKRFRVNIAATRAIIARTPAKGRSRPSTRGP